VGHLEPGTTDFGDDPARRVDSVKPVRVGRRAIQDTVAGEANAHDLIVFLDARDGGHFGGGARFHIEGVENVADRRPQGSIRVKG